jgi:RNA recognition motif-containing protein
VVMRSARRGVLCCMTMGRSSRILAPWRTGGRLGGGTDEPKRRGDHGEACMNIYVGNLSFDVTEADLRAAFEAFGAVASVSIIKDQYSRQSRGFGFVEMPSASEAQAAISSLHGKDLKGRTLNVNEARPREGGSRSERRPGGFGGGGGGRRRG